MKLRGSMKLTLTAYAEVLREVLKENDVQSLKAGIIAVIVSLEAKDLPPRSKTQQFKNGDLVFVKDKYGALQSTKVWSTTDKRVIVQNWQGIGEDELGCPYPPARYVSYNKVQLQSEWEKEHNI